MGFEKTVTMSKRGIGWNALSISVFAHSNHPSFSLSGNDHAHGATLELQRGQERTRIRDRRELL